MEKRFQTFKFGLDPCWRFFRGYFFRLGFLDGLPGLIIASSSYYECILKYAYHKEIVISSND